MITYNLMNHKDFQSIKKGDIFYGKIYGEYKQEEAASDAFYNTDADEPEWEVEAVSGAFYCADSVYKRADSQFVKSNNEEKVKNLIALIKELLPKEPRSFYTSGISGVYDPGFWTNGSEILCPSEEKCEMLAEFFKDVVSEDSNVTVLTGYYDPFEDSNNEEPDDMTGFYYIQFE